MTKHARVTLLAALLAAAWLLPFRGQDPADLLPVQTLVMDCRDGQVYLYGDGGLEGQGASPAQAMDALVQNAPGRAYLAQTEHLVVTQPALSQVAALYEAASLRLACGVFQLSGQTLPRPEDLTDYLTAWSKRSEPCRLARFLDNELAGQAAGPPRLDPERMRIDG